MLFHDFFTLISSRFFQKFENQTPFSIFSPSVGKFVVIILLVQKQPKGYGKCRFLITLLFNGIIFIIVTQPRSTIVPFRIQFTKITKFTEITEITKITKFTKIAEITKFTKITKFTEITRFTEITNSRKSQNSLKSKKSPKSPNLPKSHNSHNSRK